MCARLLLVHSPLVGRATWDLVAADQAGRGYQVGLPDLTGAAGLAHLGAVRAAPNDLRAVNRHGLQRLLRAKAALTQRWMGMWAKPPTVPPRSEAAVPANTTA